MDNIKENYIKSNKPINEIEPSSIKLPNRSIPDKNTKADNFFKLDKTKSTQGNISLLANDINNQLSGIIGNAELLKQDGIGPYEKSQLICNIIACARETTHLTDKIIAIENNQPIPEKSVIRKVHPKPGCNTVLIIDDEEVVRKVAKSILQTAGYDILLAANGKEGIDIYNEHKREILCVLLDLTMPYLPGNLVYAKLKAIDPSVKVLLMSGLNINQVMQQFEKEDIAAFIKKPFMMEELIEHVKAIGVPAVH